MHLLFLSLLIFLLLTSYGSTQEVKVDEWLQARNCIPGSPVVLDFCTCKCTELNAALRASPDLQVFFARRMEARRRGIAKEDEAKKGKGKAKEDSTTLHTFENPVTPGVEKCWETCVDSLVG